MFQRFNERARQAIDRAASLAESREHPCVEPEHLLASMADMDDASFHSLLQTFDVPTDLIRGVPLPEPRPVAPEDVRTGFSIEAKRVLEYAVEEADRLGHRRIGCSHFVLGLLRDELERQGSLQVLTSLGLSLDDVRARLREEAEDPDGKRDVVPSILFFELDRRARESERKLAKRIDELERDNRSLRGLIELAGERVAKLEALADAGGLAGAQGARAAAPARGTRL